MMKYKVATFEDKIPEKEVMLALQVKSGASIIDIEFFHGSFMIQYYEAKVFSSLTFILTNSPGEIMCSNPPKIRLRRFYAGKMYYLIEAA